MGSRTGTRGSWARAAFAVAVFALAVFCATAYSQPIGRTTEQVTIAPGGPLDPARPVFVGLRETAGSPRQLRELPKVGSQALRTQRRRSLAYFAQLSDFQLADEESPARIEALDRQPNGGAAWRPEEALQPATVDSAMRQLNRFTTASPYRQAGGRRAPLDFALITGDQADNQQWNENVWARQLVEGGQTLDPNSGTSDYSRCSDQNKTALSQRPADEARRYTGVQDYNDYEGGNGSPIFYDPNRPEGDPWSQWPRYPGLMDRAQRPFTTTGLRRGNAPVPTYVTNGNHDGLLQGAQQATERVEEVATGCFKPFSGQAFVPSALPDTTSGFAVPPDARRYFTDRVQLKRIYERGHQPDGHGFRFVSPAENAASGFSASYYAWDPKPGVRFISLDTVAYGGDIKDSFDGNIDTPQFRWLTQELAAAKGQKKIVVVFGHHPIRSLRSTTPDEAAAPCTGRYPSEDGTYSGSKDEHGHDINPGCDMDPRDSRPLHLGPDLVNLFNRNPNVVAYIAGHIHRNRIYACGSPSGCPKSGRGNWWEITVAATADWPQQNRLAEIMNNRDGTLSILSGVLDQGSSATIPPPTTSAAATNAFSEEQLASLSRSFSFNEPQAARAGGPGGVRDRNVELLVKDPRAGNGAGKCMLATGRVTAKAIGRARLGRKRTTVRKAYSRTSLKKGRSIDSFCLLNAGTLRVGFPSAKLRGKLSRGELRRVKDRAVLLLGAKTRYKVRGVRVRTSLRTLRRKVKKLKRYRVGRNTWYLARGGSSRLVFKVRGGKVREAGVADLKLTATKKRALRFLKSF